MMWGCPWCGGFGYGGFGWLWGILWLALMAWLVYALVRALSGSAPSVGREDRALEILKERYARGEIDRETFEQMRRDLGS